MERKYLKELNFSSDEYNCIPNAKIQKEKNARTKRYKKQRKKYGFDERETWAMDFTLACWIYEHFKWYVEYAPIDMSFHKFEIEIIEDFEEKKPVYRTIQVNQKEAIDYVFEYLEAYLKDDGMLDYRTYYYYVCGLKIVAEIMPAMWW